MAKTNKSKNSTAEDSKKRDEAAVVLGSINAGIQDADNGRLYTTSEVRKLLKNYQRKNT